MAWRQHPPTIGLKKDVSVFQFAIGGADRMNSKVSFRVKSPGFYLKLTAKAKRTREKCQC